MNPQNLTEEEKRAVSRVLQKQYTVVDIILGYVAYLFPPTIFAFYGFWTRDYVAVTVAYGILTILVVIYLNRSWTRAISLFSAIRKYEEMIGALRNFPKTDTRAS